MKIIISPAKKMRALADYPEPASLPALLERSQRLLSHIQKLSYSELKTLLNCNDVIAAENYARFQSMRLDDSMMQRGNSAILSYDGIQYAYMAPQVFEQRYFDYVQAHVRILSGFFGILRPLDAVVPYRLEMQARLCADGCRNLYEFWKDALYRELAADERGGALIVNLASAEYARAVLPYLSGNDRLVSCVFGQLENGRIREKGVYVKMARGEMVRFMAERAAFDVSDIAAFDRLGFHLYSMDENRFVFVKS